MHIWKEQNSTDRIPLWGQVRTGSRHTGHLPGECICASGHLAGPSAAPAGVGHEEAPGAGVRCPLLVKYQLRPRLGQLTCPRGSSPARPCCLRVGSLAAPPAHQCENGAALLELQLRAATGVSSPYQIKTHSECVPGIPRAPPVCPGAQLGECPQDCVGQGRCQARV